MTSLSYYEDQCTKNYRKYADTVAVSFAIYHFITTQLKNAAVAIEHKLVNTEGHELRPDVMAIFKKERKAVLFELKWSLPFDDGLLEKELKELKKYVSPCSGWGTNQESIDSQDLVLICHVDDAQKTVDMIKKLSDSKEWSFFREDGFAVWSWTITSPKGGERKEEMRVFPVYGKIRHVEMQNLIQTPGGILIPECVLTYLRWSLTFVKEKPPVQYTMTVLIQYVFAPIQQVPERKVCEVELDWIYEQMKKFFISWHEFDTPTIQAKRSWIREALEKLWELKIIEKTVEKPDMFLVPIPTLKTKRPIQEVICKKLSRQHFKELKKRKRGAGRTRPVRPKGPRKEKPLTDYL
ncbi:MAG: hypothetical protein QXQ94_08510 [Candidatus Bathyarchaeia archaeon]